MRVATTLAVVALLALAGTCSGTSLFRSRGAKKSAAIKPVKTTDHGRGYALVSELIAALHYKNYTKAGSLLADDGLFFVSDISCDPINKTQLMNAVMSEQLSASQVILGEWVESDGATYIKAQVGAIFGPNSPLANQTLYNPNVYLAAMPSMDGTQLMLFERLTDASWRQQNNASDMMNVFNTIVAANELGDVKPWLTLVASDFEFRMDYAWDQYPSVKSNSTVFIDTLTHQYQRQLFSKVRVNNAFPVCEIVLGDIMVFQQNKDGRAMVQKFFISVGQTEAFQIRELTEIAQTYF
jgi:hypothetical protein